MNRLADGCLGRGQCVLPVGSHTLYASLPLGIAGSIHVQPFVAVLVVLRNSQTNLFQVRLTRGTMRIFAGSGKDREQNRCENRNEYQQFYKSEGATTHSIMKLGFDMVV